MLNINTNVASLNAQRNISTTQGGLATSLQRLSSGLRINSAKDDAAGLAISERMNSQIRGLDQARRNANDGISLVQTAEGALAEIGNNVQRIRELSVQAANSTNTQTDRDALQTEVAALKEEIDRVADQTSFNGTKLLDGTFTAAQFQVGADANQTIAINSIVDANVSSLGGTTNYAMQGYAVNGITTTTALVAGSLTIDGPLSGGVAVDVGPIAAASSVQERVGQVVDAINKVSTQTGVSAAFNSSTGEIELQADGTFTVGGTAAATDVGVDKTAGAAGVIAAAPHNGITDADVTGYAAAQLTIKLMDSALKQINTTRANLGATQNRFESTISNLQSSSENLSAARSRILDADFAAETAKLSRNQVLQQAGTAMLAQANQLPQGVLSLLR